jgi:type I restriction enzyme M protein
MPLSKFNAIRQGTLNRFYTRRSVGELLADQLAHLNPSSVIDLGAGDGSLSISTANYWPNADILTVDLDADCIPRLHKNIMNAGAASHRHKVHDVFDPALPKAIGQSNCFDLAVCNPPFFRPDWRRDFARILQEANLADACPSTSDVSAEIIFLAQNLRLVRDGGTIAMIAPDGMMTGWKTKPLRRTLIAQHKIDCVVQLPPHSFHDTEARCFVLILTKQGRQAEQVKLLRYDVAAGLSDPLYVSIDEAEQRLDYDYHVANQSKGKRVVTLRELGADIQRGSVSTVEARTADFPIFHTSDYSNLPDGEIRLESSMPAVRGKRLITVAPGDILMARVDRKLHEKVAIVVSGEAALTDCVYRVRLPKEAQQLAFRALRSLEGASKLLAISKGVSARLLGKADLLDMLLTV